MNEYIKETLLKLSENDCAGHVRSALDTAINELSKYAAVSMLGKGAVGYMGEGEYTLMLAAHIDEVSFTVTNIDENGFLTLSKCGGIDLRHLPSLRVKIHGKETVNGVFCSVPPHLKHGDIDFSDIGNFKVDSLLGEKAREVISEGDIVTYAEKPRVLKGDRISGKSLDNRVGVTMLLETARRLSECELPFRVAFCFTNEEELGLRGAKTAAFGINPDEAIAVDVTFGDGPDIKPDDCKPLSSGAAVGIAPILCKDIYEKLITLSKQNCFNFTKEIMTSSTGTDADQISVSREGIKTGLLSVPIRNMHTPCEIVDLRDIKSACDILQKYILSGGIKNV